MSSTDFVVVHGALISYTGNAEKIIIPEGVVKIGSDAFKSSDTLRVVSFNGNTLKSIEAGAFAQCSHLERVVLPEGLVQICDHAFYGCDSLLYMYIPASVMVIGEEAIVTRNKKFFILGKSKSEAERYSKDRKFTFKTDIDRTINALNSYSTTKSKVRTATFDIFGEKITCSNTLATYHAVLEYYAERKDIVFEEFVNTLPTTVTEGVKGNPAAVLEREQTNTLTRLDNYGIISGELSTTCNLALAQAAELILKETQAIIKAYNAVCNSTRESIDDNYQQLIREAESHVTGLSYGRIGSSFDMVLYAVDDYRAKQRQRKEAYAIADKKADEYRTRAISEAEKAYTEMLQKVTPVLRQGTDMYVDALCNAEIQKLIEEGLIDAATVQSIDIAKSTELINSIMDAQGDNSFVLGLALQKYPCNIAALVYAIEHGYRCDGIKDLISFLGLGSKISEIIKKNQVVRYQRFIEKAKEVAAKDPNKIAALVKQKESNIRHGDMQEILRICGKTISDRIWAIVIQAEDINEELLQTFCMDELNKTIKKTSWDYLCGFGPIPIDLLDSGVSHSDIYKFLYCQVKDHRAEIAKENKRKKMKRISLVVVAVLIIMAGIAAVVARNILEEKKYTDLQLLLDTGNVTAEDLKTSGCEFGDEGRGTQLVVEKLSEYHASNNVEDALNLLVAAFGYVSLGDDSFYATKEFRNWIIEAVQNAGECNKSSKYTYGDIYGYHLRWNEYYLWLDLGTEPILWGDDHELVDGEWRYWFIIRTSNKLSYTTDIVYQIQ